MQVGRCVDQGRTSKLPAQGQPRSLVPQNLLCRLPFEVQSVVARARLDVLLCKHLQRQLARQECGAQCSAGRVGFADGVFQALAELGAAKYARPPLLT